MRPDDAGNSRPSHEEARAVIVMGVSGSGKTTVGRLMAERLGWEFADADAFHSEQNIDKMRTGKPLDDADRRPWLETLGNLIADRLSNGLCLVLACSALKREYRRLLTRGDERVSFVYLKGSRELIYRRLERRGGHYMKPDLLDSQFQALEEPSEALILDVSRPPVELAESAALQLKEEA